MTPANDRAKLVEARVEDYLHRAKRMVIDAFGTDASRGHSDAAATLALAMCTLEAAQIMRGAAELQKDA